MKLQLSCGCCTPLCYKKWMPRDEVVRHIRLTGQTLTMKNHPYEVADGMALPFDGLPTGALPLSGPGDFPHGSGQGLGYYGISTGAHRLHMYLEYDDQELFTWEADQTLIDTELSVDSDAGPLAAWYIPIDFNDTQQPVCYKAANGGGIQNINEEDFGLDSTPPVEIDHDNMLYYGGPLWMDQYRYHHVKAIAWKYGSVPNLSYFPKTYAEIAQHAPGDWILYDIGLIIAHNAAVGDVPASILSVPADQLRFGPSWIGDYDESYEAAIDDEALHIQPDGGSAGGGFGFPSQYQKSYWRPNITPGEEGFTGDAIITGRSVSELVNYTPFGFFQDGNVYAGATIWAHLQSTQDVKTISQEFVSDTIGSQVYPIQGEPTIGFPSVLSSNNNFGFYTFALHLDADWNIDKLGKYELLTQTDSLYSLFAWHSKGNDGWQWADGEIVEYAEPRDLRARPPRSTTGVSGYTLPFFDGTRRMRYSFETYYPTTPPFGFPPPAKPTTTNVFNDYYAGSTGQGVLYASDSKKSGWRRPEDFTDPMTAYPANTIPGDSSPGFGEIDGHVVAGAQPGDRPSVTYCGESSTAEFTREETPEEE
ncbi:MAG: hypothetical protein ABGW98_11015 [Myxococcales bacterium]